MQKDFLTVACEAIRALRTSPAPFTLARIIARKQFEETNDVKQRKQDNAD